LENCSIISDIIAWICKEEMEKVLPGQHYYHGLAWWAEEAHPPTHPVSLQSSEETMQM
jgi:hypothetical protein